MLSHFSDIDLKILSQIQNNASLTTAEIAEKIGSSQSPCWRRIHRLEDGGVIKRRVAILDYKKLGMELVAFVSISLSAHGRQNLESFETQIVTYPEVLQCYTVTGQMDYMLKIMTKNIQHYEMFMRDKLMTMPMVQEMHTTIAVTEIKDTTELPLSTQL